jgi:fructokinase
MRIGVDLGGTKTEAIALDSSGQERFRQRVPTPREDYAATIRTIVDLVAAAERAAGPGSVGIGIPGAVSPATGLIKNANSTWLNGQRFAEDLADALGRPVRLANDANCFALSEATDGAAAGHHVVFGVIIGTGTGGAVVINGRPLTGVNAIAGEWGHNPLPAPNDEERPGNACYCGRFGCIETFLSGPGLSNDYQRLTGVRVDATAIAERAAGGERQAIAAFERYEDRMARALGSIINVLDPDVIVLGGGLSNVERLYDNVPARWRRYIFSDAVTTKLRRAAHGDSSGVRGAAWLWE